jgi:cytochrome P450
LFAEIARRRADPDHGGVDVMSLLVQARDEDGRGFSDREVRDQVMTMLFAGHDTTTSTVTFLFHELAHHPEEAARLEAEQDEVVGDRPPAAADLAGGMPRLEMAVDETLRMYPPAWVGPRRAAQRFEFAGQVVPENVCVNYCSWASHRIPSVFPEPDEFRPDRFAPAAKAALPKGAYVPFGGGSRTCIGMRFGLMETRAIAAMLLRRFRVELPAGHRLSIRQMPTLSPRGGLPVTLRAR